MVIKIGPEWLLQLKNQWTALVFSSFESKLASNVFIQSKKFLQPNKEPMLVTKVHTQGFYYLLSNHILKPLTDLKFCLT